MATIIYGPQGCGKALISKMLAERFGCSTVVDDYHSGYSTNLPENSVALTCENMPGALHFFDVLRDMDARHKDVNRINYMDIVGETTGDRP